MVRRFFLMLSFWCFGILAQAQEINWPSPEVAQLYNQAKSSLSKGAVDQSIILFRQAIQLAPDVMILYRDLAQALNIAGKYAEAYETLAPIINKGLADDLSYQIAGAALTNAKNTKKAKAVLEQGIAKYPHSGLLYYEQGRFYEQNDDIKNALNSWLSGIKKDPAYHLNYYAAAQAFTRTNKPVWTILYGEIFVNMERQTNRSYETRKMVLDAYKKMFNGIGSKDIPAFGSAATNRQAVNFETAVIEVYSRLSPVVGDGLTTENLTMLRTRFLMEWDKLYKDKYPFTLFTYHDKLLRNGKFDAYNQWLWGKTEDEKQFANWMQFHNAAMSDYEQWAGKNKLLLNSSDHYNTTDIKTLFGKKKK